MFICMSCRYGFRVVIHICLHSSSLCVLAGLIHSTMIFVALVWDASGHRFVLHGLDESILRIVANFLLASTPQFGSISPLYLIENGNLFAVFRMQLRFLHGDDDVICHLQRCIILV